MQTFCILPQNVACTKRFFRQTALIYLSTTNRLVFVMGTDCVLCDVGIEVLPTRTHPWTHYLPTGLDNLPAATVHTNTRL